ncbi:hypothetical protein FA13DRAFT_825259 [Coprinellus micaceus]|uniref:Uncharacterized protein n=1 Tax=Coprinellus micaceus TaxID=71717 RepID=A0A4Y7T2Z3_COPMI|nr:hypothetical protein FA13DRAFT_825259 [Coprinellus micaceus]
MSNYCQTYHRQPRVRIETNEISVIVPVTTREATSNTGDCLVCHNLRSCQQTRQHSSGGRSFRLAKRSIDGMR